MNKALHFRSRRRRGRPVWTGRNGRRPALVAADIRMMIWAGLILGLIAFQALRLFPHPSPLETPSKLEDPTDPFAESRRSRSILAAQEGAPAPVHAQERPRAHTQNAHVSPGRIRVIDGDTFDVDGVRIRIADIDTPEVKGRCASESALAARATNRMRQLLLAGPVQLAPIDRDRDSYGRRLRIVLRDGRSLGDQLVAEGLARTWTGRREPWC